MKQDEASPDTQALRALNLRIGEAENVGDRTWLAGVLAPRLAFQRADPARSVDDAEAYLAKVKAGGDRETRIVEPIEVFGNRAVVQCVVRSGGSITETTGLGQRDCLTQAGWTAVRLWPGPSPGCAL